MELTKEIIRVICGSPFVGSIIGTRFPNWPANKVLALASNILYRASINDVDTCYKAFRADLTKPIRLKYAIRA